MPEWVAIVGSRTYPDQEAVREYVRSLPEDTVVVSGGAKGVDKWAENEANRIGLKVFVHKADWGRYGKRAGFIRNNLIVRDSDRAVAFWDGVSRGTQDTIKKFNKAGKPCEVRTP